MKKATVDNLIKLGLESERNRTGTIKVDTLGLEFEYNKLPIMQVMDIADEYDDSNTGQLNMAMELIYMTIPIFRDKKLQEQFKVAEPYEVVLKVLGDNVVTVGELGKEVMKLYNVEHAVDDVKK